MLFDPDRHEPLRAAAWDEGCVRADQQHIADDTLAQRSALLGAAGACSLTTFRSACDS